MKRNWWMGLALHEPETGAGGGSAGAGDGGTTGDGQGKPPETDKKETETKVPAAGAYTQADVDRMVSQAIKTREQKLKEQHEQEKMTAEGKFKELYEKEVREKSALAIRVQTREALEEKGLGEFATFFEGDTSTLEGRVKTAEGFKAKFDAAVKAEVLKRLETPAPGKGGPTPSPGKVTPEQVEKMSQAEYEAAVKKGLIG